MAIFFVAPAMATEMDAYGVIETETGFYYVVKKGDTLWDLSRKFNDSPWIWPDLWSHNDQITNPHWIFPGQRIQVYRKSDVMLPAGQMAEGTVRKEKPAGPDVFNYPAIIRAGFIRKPPVEPVGRIKGVSTEKTLNLLGEGDTVYVQPAEGVAEAFTAGSKYTLFRYLNPTVAPRSNETIGTQHFIVGVVEVLRKDGNIVTAQITKSFRPIEGDDLLMPFVERDPDIPIIPADPDVEGQVIGPEDHQVLIGDYTVIFIDKGKRDNIKNGQEYTLFRHKELGRKVQSPPIQVGKIRVVHTEETTATVVITGAVLDVRRGDWFRASVQ